jgi:hypothetical protein
MNWDRSIDLFVNVGMTPDYVLLASRGALQAAEMPVLVSGDTHPIRLWLLKPAAPGTPPLDLALAVGDQIIVSGRKSDGSELLFVATDFVRVDDADGLHFEGTLNLKSQMLADAFGSDTAILVTVQVEIENSGNTAGRSRQFRARINKGIYNGEFDPTPVAPAYPQPGALLTTGTDTATLKRGTINLAAGDTAKAILFVTPFSAPPTNYRAWVMKKAGADAIQAFECHDTVTEAGFTAELGAAVPPDAVLGDYKLGWIALI